MNKKKVGPRVRVRRRRDVEFQSYQEFSLLGLPTNQDKILKNYKKSNTSKVVFRQIMTFDVLFDVVIFVSQNSSPRSEIQQICWLPDRGF